MIIIILFLILTVYIVYTDIGYKIKQKVRIEQAEYTQRYITNNRKGYNNGEF